MEIYKIGLPEEREVSSNCIRIRFRAVLAENARCFMMGSHLKYETL